MRKRILNTCKGIFSLLLFFILTGSAAAQTKAKIEQEKEARKVQFEKNIQKHWCGSQEHPYNRNLKPKDIKVENRLSQFRNPDGTWNVQGSYGASCTNNCISEQANTCSGAGNEVYRLPLVYTVSTTTGCSGSAAPSITEIQAMTDIMTDFFACQGIDIAFYTCTEFADAPGGIRSGDFGCVLDESTISNIPNAVNIYIFPDTGNGTGCNGFAYLPGSTNSPTTVAMSNNCYSGFSYTGGLDCNNPMLGSGQVLVHELGHYLGLYHTHGTYAPGPHPDYPGNGGDDTATNNYFGTISEELVDGSNSCTTGDFIEDTAADIGISHAIAGQGTATGTPSAVPNPVGGCATRSGCDITMSSAAGCLDANGATYMPPETNIMSYNILTNCINEFSDCQKAKMMDALLCVRGPQACCRDVDAEFANGEDDTNVEICIGDAIPMFTATDACYIWYDGLGTSANQLATGATYTPTAALVDVNTPGDYTIYLGDVNEINPDCRTPITVTVLANTGIPTANTMTTLTISDCSAATDVALTTDVTSLGEDCVIGWWITEDNPASMGVTDDATLMTAVNAATIGGTISNPVNNLIESTGGTPTKDLTASFDCSSLDANTTYYATPVVAKSAPAVADATCDFTYNDFATSVGGDDGRAATFNAGSITCAPANPTSPPTFTISIDVTNFTGTPNALRLRVRLFSNCDFTGQIAQTVAGNGTYTFTQADFPAGFDPNADGMCFLIYEGGNDNAGTADMTVSLDITYPGEPAVPFPSLTEYNSCLFGTPVEISCDCSDCPTPVTVANATGTTCSGAGTDDYATWKAAIDTANPLDGTTDPSSLGTIVYTSVAPAVGGPAPDGIEPTGTHSDATSCDFEMQTVMAYLYCDTDNDNTINAGDTYTLLSTYMLTVNPAPQTPTISRDDATCAYSYTAACTGDSFSPDPIPTAAPGTDPAAFMVTVTNDEGCMAMFSVDPEACPPASPTCPTANNVTDMDAVCSGALTNEITSWQGDIAADAMNTAAIADGNTAAAIEYSTQLVPTDAATPDGMTASGTHSDATSCDAETQTTYAYLLCFGTDGVMGGTDDSYLLLGTHTLTVNPAPQTPTVSRDDATCAYSYMATCTDDTFSPDPIPTAAPGTDPAAFMVTVTNDEGCTAMFSVDPEACPATPSSTINIDDPCTCENNGSDGMVGTFSETVEIMAPTGQTWTVVSSTGVTGVIDGTTTFTETSTGVYELTFTHADGVGYYLSANNGAETLYATNVCEYPDPSFNLATVYCIDDNTDYDLTAMPIVMESTGVAGTFSNFLIDGAAATTFNPMTLGAGTYTVTAQFDGNGTGGNGMPSGSATDAYQGTDSTVPAATMPVGSACFDVFMGTITVVDCSVCNADNGAIIISTSSGGGTGGVPNPAIKEEDSNNNK